MEPVVISAAQKAAADKKFQELQATNKPEEKIAAKPAEGEQVPDAVIDDTATGDAGKEDQDKKVETKPEEKVPEKKAGEKPDEEVEEAEELPVDESDAIAAQEALIADTPPKKEKKEDKTPIEERAEWKKARLREKQRIEALERKIAELEVKPLGPATTDAPAVAAQAPALTPATVEAQIVQMDKDWNDGKYPDWDFARLEREKLVIEIEARTAARNAEDRARETREAAEKRIQSEQAEVTARIDKAVLKTEPFLPGLKEAVTAIARDKVIGPDPIIGQAILQNLDKGGLHVAYYLHHHRDFAASLIELPVDERAAKLYDLRMKLTKPKKAATVKTDFKPDTPIVNSHIPDASEKEKNRSSDSDVEAEIQKARKNRR